MNDICQNCGHWRGLHKWDTMQCPFDEHENNTWMESRYKAANTSEVRELQTALALLKHLDDVGAIADFNWFPDEVEAEVEKFLSALRTKD